MDSTKYTYDMMAGGHILAPGKDGFRRVVMEDIGDANAAMATTRILEMLSENIDLARAVSSELVIIMRAQNRELFESAARARIEEEAGLKLFSFRISYAMGSRRSDFTVQARDYDHAVRQVPFANNPACIWSVEPTGDYEARIARQAH